MVAVKKDAMEQPMINALFVFISLVRINPVTSPITSEKNAVKK
jgi:hypothetical protein